MTTTVTLTAASLAIASAACTTATAPVEPAPEETFTMTTPLAVAAAPLPAERDVYLERIEGYYGTAPWVGRLTQTEHHYSNGCTDHRKADILALKRSELKMPVIIGWRRISEKYRWEPRFLKDRSELPDAARSSACVLVSGHFVAYAYEGYAGSPAYAIEAKKIEPAPCPP